MLLLPSSLADGSFSRFNSFSPRLFEDKDAVFWVAIHIYSNVLVTFCCKMNLSLYAKFLMHLSMFLLTGFISRATQLAFSLG